MVLPSMSPSSRKPSVSAAKPISASAGVVATGGAIRGNLFLSCAHAERIRFRKTDCDQKPAPRRHSIYVSARLDRQCSHAILP